MKHRLRHPGASILTAAIFAVSLLTGMTAFATGNNDNWKTQESGFEPSRLDLDETADRLILVEAHGTECRVSLYARSPQTTDTSETPAEIGPGVQAPQTSDASAISDWSLLLTTTGALGANGIGKEKEGDSKTPQGLFSISPFAFGNADEPEGCAIPYHKTTVNDYWCGDSDSVYYDQLVDITKTGTVFDTAKSEHLVDYGRYYNYCLNIEYNRDHTPHKGSALFLHCNRADWSTETTHGCISINQDVMVQILQNVTTNTWLLCDTQENLQNYYLSVQEEANLS